MTALAMVQAAETDTATDRWPFPRIRGVRDSEIKPLMEMCVRLHEENGIGHRMDPNRVLAVIEKAVANKQGWIGVIGDNGRIEGSICLLINQMWYSDQWCIEEFWNYVLPEYRQSDNAKQLIRCAKWVSDEMGMPMLISILSNIRTEAKIRMYRRELGEPAGAFFLYGAKTGER